MTENLIQKLEEKITQLLSHMEMLRARTEQLKHENMILRAEHANHVKKLQGLIAVLDAMEAADENLLSPDLIAGSEEIPSYDN